MMQKNKSNIDVNKLLLEEVSQIKDIDEFIKSISKDKKLSEFIKEKIEFEKVEYQLPLFKSFLRGYEWFLARILMIFALTVAGVIAYFKFTDFSHFASIMFGASLFYTFILFANTSYLKKYKRFIQQKKEDYIKKLKLLIKKEA